MAQISFSDAEQAAKNKTTKREKFLAEMEPSCLGRLCSKSSSRITL
jgi:hypothetical protein